ncbi:hypothetical protein ACFQDE_12745 [Deinococcus caeni]|uniref:hypothetical protein n=1 Tax=Deinococcus caeni TaxID=569127 RepID=UPI00360A8424
MTHDLPEQTLPLTDLPTTDLSDLYPDAPVFAPVFQEFGGARASRGGPSRCASMRTTRWCASGWVRRARAACWSWTAVAA